MRSGLGPAPEPGRRRLSITPVGVTTRSDFPRNRRCGCRASRNGRRSASRSSRRASNIRSSAENGAASGRAGATAPRAPGRRCRPRSARRARSCRPPCTLPSRRRSMRHRALVPVALRLDAAAHARSAAERRHRRLGAAGPVEHRGDVLLVARDRRRRRARWRSRAQPAPRRGRTCRKCARRGRSARWSKCGERGRRRDARRVQLNPPARRRAAFSAVPKRRRGTRARRPLLPPSGLRPRGPSRRPLDAPVPWWASSRWFAGTCCLAGATMHAFLPGHKKGTANGSGSERISCRAAPPIMIGPCGPACGVWARFQA